MTANMFATLKLEYDATTKNAKLYYNGELTFTTDNFSPALFGQGKLGVVTEGGRSYLLKATYTVIEPEVTPEYGLPYSEYSAKENAK